MRRTVFYWWLASLSLPNVCLSQWQPVNNGLPAGSYVNALIDDGRTLFAGGYAPLGLPLLHRSSDNGNTWVESDSGISPLMPGGPWAEVSSFAFRRNILIAGTADTGVYRSTDHGVSWRNIHGARIPNYLKYLSYATDTVLVLGTRNRVYESRNDGASWDSIGVVTTTYIAALFARERTLLAGAYRGMYRSSDGGGSWTIITNGLPVNNYIFGFGGYGTLLFAGGHTDSAICLYRSSDDGISWTSVRSGLPTISWARAFASYLGAVFVGTGTLLGSGSGVFCSTDNGTNWVSVSLGLPQAYPVKALHVYNGYLFAGTGANGVWRRPLSELVSVREWVEGGVPQDFALRQNYPNPFNPTTVIQYALPVDAHVSLTVYDVLGRDVQTLVNDVVPAGYHQVRFDASALSTGVYFAHFVASDLFGHIRLSKTTKLALVR